MFFHLHIKTLRKKILIFIHLCTDKNSSPNYQSGSEVSAEIDGRTPPRTKSSSQSINGHQQQQQQLHLQQKPLSSSVNNFSPTSYSTQRNSSAGEYCDKAQHFTAR